MPNGKGNKGHPRPDQNSSDTHQRKITGEIGVRIEADIVSRFIEQYKATRNENTSRDNLRFAVEIGTLLIVLVYAGITVLIFFANKKSADAAKSAIDITVEEDRARIESVNTILDPPVPGQPVHIVINFQNKGKLPAYNFRVDVAPVAYLSNSPTRDAIPTTQGDGGFILEPGAPGYHLDMTSLGPVTEEQIASLPGVLDDPPRPTFYIFGRIMAPF